MGDTPFEIVNPFDPPRPPGIMAPAIILPSNIRMDAARRRARRRDPRRLTPSSPDRVERSYERKLARRARELDQFVLPQLLKFVRQFDSGKRTDSARRADSAVTDFFDALFGARNEWQRREAQPETQLQLFDAAGEAVALHSANEVARVVRDRIPIISAAVEGAETRGFIAAWGSEQRRLITSVDARYFDDIQAIVRRGFEEGMPGRDIAKALQGKVRGFAGPGRQATINARRIARTEVSKLNSELTRSRYKSFGVTQARWMTSRDVRVRVQHRRVNGVVFDLAGPGVPNTGTRGEPSFPGLPINCRCRSAPVL